MGVEVITLGWQILKSLDLKKAVKLELNTLGDTESRLLYRQALVTYFQCYKTDFRF